MRNPFFNPWKPPGFNGTLILGESCPKGDETSGITGWRAHPDSEWPHNFIIRHVEEKRLQDDSTFRALRSSFVYDGAVLESVAFWDAHAFSNLVPRLMGRRPSGKFERPGARDKEPAREQFRLILEDVQPSRVLIASAWGTEVLKDLSDTHKYDAVQEGWQMAFDQRPAIGIYHPQAWNQQGYSIDQARRATALLRTLPTR